MSVAEENFVLFYEMMQEAGADVSEWEVIYDGYKFKEIINNAQCSTGTGGTGRK